MGALAARWPLGRGFERFYGFLAGETDQYHPDLVHDNHQIDPPRTPEEGYHLTEDLVDHAIGYIDDLRAVSADRPFFLYLTPGACHAPHQAPEPYRSRHRGRYDLGWDAWREEVFARQQASGLLPDGTRSSASGRRGSPRGTRSSDDERRLYARMMEVYAGFLEHTDAQIGRLVDHLEQRRRARQHDHPDHERQRRQRRGRAAGARSTRTTSSTWCPRAWRRTSRRIDDLGGPARAQPLPVGLGVGGQHAAASGGSGRPTRAASPTR